jgi:hypothetical protein
VPVAVVRSVAGQESWAILAVKAGHWRHLASFQEAMPTKEAAEIKLRERLREQPGFAREYDGWGFVFTRYDDMLALEAGRLRRCDRQDW